MFDEWRAAAAVVLIAGAFAVCSAELPPTDQSYRIEVRLDPETRELSGHLRVTWVNRSDHAIDAVPVHLFLNGFSHQGTTWMRGRYGTREPGWLERYDDPWGYIEPLSIRQVAADDVRTEAACEPIRPDDGNPLDRSLIEVRLPAAVAQGAALTLEIEFEARLPHTIARTGCVPGFCMVAQWFPKIGVLELPGTRGATEARWAARQFHGSTEFYADFADYDVTIDVPEGWHLGATGRRVEDVAGESGRRRVRYRQRAVHDFAFAVGRELIEEYHRHDPPGAGGEVELHYLIPDVVPELLPPVRRITEGSIDVMARRVGPYPYDTLTVVYVPFEAVGAGGMEYPTLFTGSAGDPLFTRPPFDRLPLALDVAAHELAHQYFQGVVASNEQEEPFLDEGLTSYWEVEIMREVFRDELDRFSVAGRTLDLLAGASLSAASGMDEVREPLRKRPGSLFYPGTWPLQAYSRPALILDTAANLFGREPLDAVFATYVERYRFRHPAVEDFLAVAREAGGDELADFLTEAFDQPRIPDYSVAEVSTRRFEAPRGRVTTASGPLTVGDADRDDALDAVSELLPRSDRETVRLEVTDPGWVRGDERQAGSVRWLELEPRVVGEAPEPEEEGDGTEIYETRIRLEGPGWKHLPVEVRIRFEDGTEVREVWDGRAVWRAYRMFGVSRFEQVRLDPEGKLTVDPKPQNNGRRIEPDERLQSDWGLWLGALAQWVAGTVTLWL